MALQIIPPQQIYYDKDGLPLDAGYIYIGAVSQNPETTPVSIYWDPALTQPAPQPIRTINGFASRQGIAANIYTNSAFSVTVKNRTGQLVYSSRNGASSGGGFELLVFSDYTSASNAATTLPSGQIIEAPDNIGRLSRFEVQSGGLVFIDYVPDAIRLQSYSALRAYSGKYGAIDITTPGVAGRFNLDASDSTSQDNGGTILVGFGGRRWKRVVTGILTPEMFGIIGSGADETTQLQRLLDSSVGAQIIWPNSKTYNYTFLTVPDGVSFVGANFTFRRISSSTSPGFRVGNWFNAESLRISSPGGTSGDKALRIQGSFVNIGYFHAEADSQGVYNSTNWAIEIESNPAGSILSRINIGHLYCKNYSTAIIGTKLAFIEISNGVVENYRTAVYLKDTVNSEFSNFDIYGLGNAVNGAPGENGLLIEANSVNASSNLVFNNWIVEDSGEHAYRLGGQQTISNVWFNKCVSKRSGSSILSGNLSSGEWHGGCGFKILGGASVGGTRHKNIYLNQCQVFDVNQTEGSYPAGHGVNNFTPYMIVSSDGVYLNECITDAEQLPAASRNGILVGHSKGVYLNNCDFRKLRLIAIKPYQETVFPGFPDYATPLEEFHVRGGRYEVISTVAGSGLVFYMEEAALYPHKNWTIEGSEFRGGAAAMRIENSGAGGSYSQCRASFSYFDPTSVSDSTATTSIIAGGGMASWIIDLTSNNRPSASGITVANASVHRQLDTGLFRLRKAASWVTL